MSETKPTAGALRAARRVTNLVRSAPTYGCKENENMDYTVANIIDCETARLKVEELVKLGLYQTRWEHIFNRLLSTAGDKYIDELRALRFMLREVEAALKRKEE